MLRSLTCIGSFAAIVLSLAAGCRPAEQVRSYTVPKEQTPPSAAAANAVEPGEPTDRMLAAIVPAGGQAWVYKVVGPIAAIDAKAEDVVKFIASVPASAGAALPPWKLPEGWTQTPGDGFRLATIHIPAEGKPLELTLNQVPWQGTAAQVLQNVNRWRGQLKLPETTAAAMASDVREMDGASGKITLVDLKGRSGGTGMMPPFAGGAMSGGGAARGELPAGHPPIGDDKATAPSRGAAPPAATTAESGGGSGEIQFTKPASWQVGPPSTFVKSSFQIADGGQTAKVTISEFDASSAQMIADPLANINRWRGEVGLPPVEADGLDKSTEPLDIDGQKGKYVALVADTNPADATGQARGTLGAMVTVGGKVWFIKMSGSRALVAGRQDEFKAFLQSVRFAK